jgi:hypothetical protein
MQNAPRPKGTPARNGVYAGSLLVAVAVLAVLHFKIMSGSGSVLQFVGAAFVRLLINLYCRTTNFHVMRTCSCKGDELLKRLRGFQPSLRQFKINRIFRIFLTSFRNYIS